MVKKGVILDNGKTAQSSMSLYWRKQRQNARKPKKQYEPTEQQMRDQQAESGFQKWKQYKEKAINKAFIPKKDKTAKANKQEEQEQEQYMKDLYHHNQTSSKPVSIPGFKSKQGLVQKLSNPQSHLSKTVDQSNNVLKLPSSIQSLSQSDIARILKEKKAKKNKITEKVEQPNLVKISEDILLGDHIELSKPKEKQKIEEKQIQEEEPQEQPFFKSNILNELAKGNQEILNSQKNEPIGVVEHNSQQQGVEEEEKPINHIENVNEAEEPKKKMKLKFRPRNLGNPTTQNSDMQRQQ